MVKGKISILTNLILVKGVRDTTVITKSIADNPQPQAVNIVGQARVRIGLTPRYEAYTPLNATCMAIYPSIAHLITKPKPRHPITSPRRTRASFVATTNIAAMTGRSVSPFVIILKL
ncbi:hypothetical protein ACFX2F_004216 [Malus domestica]